MTQEEKTNFIESTLCENCNIVIMSCGQYRYIGATNLQKTIEDNAYILHDALIYVEAVDTKNQTQNTMSVTPRMLKPYQALELANFQIIIPDTILLLDANKKGHRTIAAVYEQHVKTFYAESMGIIAPTAEDIAHVQNKP